MPYALDDTIAAIASPPGGAARGILRLSGPEVRSCVERVFHAESPADLGALRAATATNGSLRLPGLASPLPCDLYLWPTARSYTGQPVAEIHTLGSRPLLEAALKALCAAGARLAEPGEFTLRAFLAGRMDLTRAEAVLGVIDAADPRELQVALGQLAGGLSAPLGQLRSRLLDLLAHLEAGLDFVDEDIAFLAPGELHAQLTAALQQVEQLLECMTCRHQTADLPRVAIMGWPNTGKSSLLNALAGRTAALVSQHPGTTRDYLTAEIDLGGLKCLLVDTAGIDPEWRDRPAGVERAAQIAGAEQTGRAELQLLCLDSSRPLNAWEQEQVGRVSDSPYEPALQGEPSAPRLLVLTKADLPRRTHLDRPAIETSSLTGQGLDRLRQRIADDLLAARFSTSAVVAGTAGRCHDSLRLAADSLRRACGLVVAQAGEELVAAELRLALDELGRVVGAVYTEDVLDRIFSRFCVGK